MSYSGSFEGYVPRQPWDPREARWNPPAANASKPTLRDTELKSPVMTSASAAFAMIAASSGVREVVGLLIPSAATRRPPALGSAIVTVYPEPFGNEISDACDIGQRDITAIAYQ